MAQSWCDRWWKFVGEMDYTRGGKAVACWSLFSQPMDFEQSDQKNGQNPCRQTITHSLRAADISLQPVHHAPGDPKRARSKGLPAATASSPLIPRARQGSVIQARPRPGQRPFPEVSEGYKFAGVSRWRGIRECMARVLPTVHAPQPIRQYGRRQYHAMGSPPDVRKPEGCCPRRSCTPSFIAQLDDLVPSCSREVRLQAFALESCLPEPKAASALTFRDNPSEALFDNGLHCCLLSVCQLSHLFKKAVWYLYGCLHTVNRIILYGKMSSHSIKRGWTVGSMKNDWKRLFSFEKK